MSHSSRDHLATNSTGHMTGDCVTCEGHMTGDCVACEGHMTNHTTSEDHMTDDHVTGDCEDVYLQLAQREHELMLAAELGKALLEKNQDLNSRNEQVVEDFTAKVEVSGYF